VRTDVAPGPWLRATAATTAVAAAAAVVSGAAGGGMSHRLLAALAAPPLAALLAAAVLAHRRLLEPALAAAAAVALAAAVPARGLHAAFAAVALAAVAVLCAATLRGARAPRSPWRDYVTLTKPRIMSLLLVTGFCGLVAGAHGLPGAGRTLAAMGGLALACGGASALNHVLDRDIDRLMGKRTERRPVAAGRVPASRALEFGLALSAASFTLLAATVNVLTAVLALAGNLFYVVVYTRLLKRATPQNIVIGGAAGAVPPLVGWAAAGHGLGLPALLLFVIVFVWTPPHFWALALLLKEHYANASVPMLPVVRGVRETERQIIRYTLALTLVTCVPYATGAFGVAYLGAALALGGVFVWLAVRLRRRGSSRDAALLFHYSLLYLALLFAAIALDAAI
jgi:heme o synthase